VGGEFGDVLAQGGLRGGEEGGTSALEELSEGEARRAWVVELRRGEERGGERREGG
jgi:hypothetical protein